MTDTCMSGYSFPILAPLSLATLLFKYVTVTSVELHIISVYTVIEKQYYNPYF